MRLGERQKVLRTLGVAVAASAAILSAVPGLVAPAKSDTSPTTVAPTTAAEKAEKTAEAPATTAAPKPQAGLVQPTTAAPPPPAEAPPPAAETPPPAAETPPPPTEAPPPTTGAPRPTAGLVQPTTPTTRPPAGLVQPAGPPAPAPEAGANGPAKPAGPDKPSVSRGGGPDSAELLRLLQQSAARRRHLDGRVTELETKVHDLESQQQAADAGVLTAEMDERAATAGLEQVNAELRRAQQAVWQALFPSPDPESAGGAGPDPADLGRSPLDRSTVRRVTTPAPAGPPIPSSPVDTTSALKTERIQRSRAAFATAVVEHARTRTVDARARVTTVNEALEAEREALGALRRELSAALLDPASLAQGGALSSGVAPSSRARSEIPADYLALYQEAAKTCPGLSWTVLAAIGSIESSHGRSSAPGVHSGANFAGASGPMQFLAPTWSAYGVDGNHDGTRDVYDPADAVYGAANYLCASGAGDPGRLPDAIWAYNHADWYVDDVLVLAFRYGVGGLEADAAADVGKLLASPNLTLTPRARADLVDGLVDPRVVKLLAAAVTNHRISVSVFQTGHSQFVAGTDRVSNHFHGRAVDIYAVDGAPVSPSNDAALDLALAILTGSPELQPDELGSPWSGLSQFPGAFTDAGHQDHLHIGWSS
jgi:hypothetical protein